MYSPHTPPWSPPLYSPHTPPFRLGGLDAEAVVPAAYDLYSPNTPEEIKQSAAGSFTVKPNRMRLPIKPSSPMSAYDTIAPARPVFVKEAGTGKITGAYQMCVHTSTWYFNPTTPSP